jgi:hypothetical protein
VNVGSGSYTVGSAYDFLKATSTTGNFQNVTESAGLNSYVTPIVSYNSNGTVAVTLTPTPGTGTGAGWTGTGGDPTAASNDLAFASGKIYTAAQFAQVQGLFNVAASPLYGTLSESGENGYWMRGLGTFGHANGFDYNASGYVLGKGWTINPDLTIGAGIANLYTGTNGNSDSTSGYSIGALGYGIYIHDRLTAAASLGIGHLEQNVSRGLPPIGLTAKSNSRGTYETAGLYLQYSLLSQSSPWFITPYTDVTYLNESLGSAAEHCAGILDLQYGTASASLAKVNGGMTAGKAIPVKYGTLTTWASLGAEGADRFLERSVRRRHHW